MDETQTATGVHMMQALRRVRRIVTAIVGTTVVLIGIALLVLPGPAFLVIPLGLGILATEFVWARRVLQKVKEKLARSKPPQ
jgi:tellurite resistance protein TerC